MYKIGEEKQSLAFSPDVWVVYSCVYYWKEVVRKSMKEDGYEIFFCSMLDLCLARICLSLVVPRASKASSFTVYFSSPIVVLKYPPPSTCL